MAPGFSNAVRPTRRTRFSAGASIAALFVLVIAGRAAAEETSAQRALLLPTTVKGTRAGTGTGWDDRIAQRLAAAGYQRSDEKLAPSELKCMDGECLERARARHKTDVAVRARLDARPFGFHVKLLLVRAGESRTSFDESECRDCSMEAAAARLDELVDRALHPVPAEAAPSPAAAAPAPNANLVSGGLRSLEEEPPSPQPAGRPGWLLGADIGLGAGIAVGLVGVGLGAKLLYDDGRPACTPVSPVTQCARIADTQGVGVGVLVAGAVVALGSAGALVALELKYGRARGDDAPRQARLAPLVAPGFAGLVIGGDL